MTVPGPLRFDKDGYVVMDGDNVLTVQDKAVAGPLSRKGKGSTRKASVSQVTRPSKRARLSGTVVDGSVLPIDGSDKVVADVDSGTSASPTEGEALVPEDGGERRRRSARVAAWPRMLFVDESADMDDVQEDSEDEYVDDVLDDSEDEYVDEEVGASADAGDLTSQVVANVALEAYTGDRGLIRIGRQPVAPQQQIRSIQLDRITAMLEPRINNIINNTDGPSFGLHDEETALAKSRLLSQLLAALEPVRDAHFAAFCAYTGTELSWAPGPLSFSMEAHYAFRAVGDMIRYHQMPNVGLIASCLNIAKQVYGPLVLPLCALWLSIYDSDIDFESKKGRWAWAYNAMMNASLLARRCRLFDVHAKQNRIWSRLGPEQQRAVLEALRTGMGTQELVDAVNAMKDPKDKTFNPFPAYHDQSINRRPITVAGKEQGEKILHQLLRIANQYALSREEFEYFLTIKAPDGKRKVFYPYHVLSRPQARGTGWDWHILLTKAKRMVKTLRKYCNLNAEKAGLGEKGLNDVTLIYFMGAYYCQQLAELRRKHSNMSEEWTLWHLYLDRIGAPVVPWLCTAFKVSLCKGPDHGIAMRCGILEPEDGEQFDPVRHIDLNRCTVELDTVLTNRAMLNYSMADFARVRAILLQVPLWHPLWRVSLGLGNELAVGDWDETIVPVPPTGQIDIPLVSLDPWFDEGEGHLEARCEECDIIFRSIGSLLRHCLSGHAEADPVAGGGSHDDDDDGDDDPDDLDADRDQADDEYWEKEKRKHVCNICHQCFAKLGTLRAHLYKAHRIGNLKFQCPHCEYQTDHSTIFKVHVEVVHNGKSSCPLCRRIFDTEDEWLIHLDVQHGHDTRLLCEECGEMFTQLLLKQAHAEVCDGTGRPFKCDKCGEGFESKRARANHMTTSHREGEYVCVCGATYELMGSLYKHLSRMVKKGESGHKRVYEK